MKVITDSRQLAHGSRPTSAPAAAAQATAPSNFEKLVQRFIAYKPEHQFKVLSARLKAHQLHLSRQAAVGRQAHAFPGGMRAGLSGREICT